MCNRKGTSGRSQHSLNDILAFPFLFLLERERKRVDSESPSRVICGVRWCRGSQHSNLGFHGFSVTCAGDSVSGPARPERRTILPAKEGGAGNPNCLSSSGLELVSFPIWKWSPRFFSASVDPSGWHQTQPSCRACGNKAKGNCNCLCTPPHPVPILSRPAL